MQVRQGSIVEAEGGKGNVLGIDQVEVEEGDILGIVDKSPTGCAACAVLKYDSSPGVVEEDLRDAIFFHVPVLFQLCSPSLSTFSPEDMDFDQAPVVGDG